MEIQKIKRVKNYKDRNLHNLKMKTLNDKSQDFQEKILIYGEIFGVINVSSPYV
jgi:hypothetical protein